MKKELEISKDFLEKNIEFFTKSDTKKLAELINHHSNLYYNKEKPIISDFEYDSLFKKLEILEKKFDIKNKQSLEVWADLVESTFKKVKHSRPMISLDNTYNEEDLWDFDERVFKNIDDENIKKIEYTLEFKFDWLWVELIYKAWELVQAITRWNGIEGEDVTENVMQIENIPKKIKYKDHLEVRWEVVMPISSFEMLNEKAKKQGSKIFSNPRNAASWSLRMKDNRVTKARKLQFFAYDLANFTPPLAPPLTGEGKFTYFNVILGLEKLGFDISSYFEVCENISEVIKKIQNFWDVKKKIDFEIDGLVLKVNNIELWQDIGFTEHHPKYAISYKFPAEIFTTKILSVDHQIGKTGTITPVANLEWVNMWGAIIRRATLHNYEEVEQLWVKIWDIVFIKRAWEVIPKIVSVSVSNNWENILPPEKCPSCQNEIKKDDDKVRFFCDNKKCPAQIVEKLIYAVWKQGFNIDSFWEKQVRKFFELWFIKDLAHIFEIKKYEKEILDLEGFQEKSVNKIIENVEKAKNTDIATLLNSLSISGVWKKTSKVLSELFCSENDLLNFSHNIEEIEKLEDIWPEIAKNLVEFFEDSENKILLEKLNNLLNVSFFNPLSNSLPEGERTELYWKKVCITWSFIIDEKILSHPNLPLSLREGTIWTKISRDDLIKKLEEVGWEFIWSVSKKLDYLLAWEKAGSKLEKANKLDVEILDLEEFLEKLAK